MEYVAMFLDGGKESERKGREKVVGKDKQGMEDRKKGGKCRNEWRKVILGMQAGVKGWNEAKKQ